MSRFAARVLTGATLAVGVALLLWLDARLPRGLLPLACAALLALLCAWELDRMGRFRGQGLGLPLALSALVLLAFEARHLSGGFPRDTAPLERLLWHYGLSAASAGGVAALRALAPGRPTQASLRPWPRVALALWLLPPLFGLVVIDEAFGLTGLALLVVLAKVGDNAAYFVGRSIGRRHPFPRISSGKTVAGCVASLVAGVATGAALLPLTLGERTLPQVFLGALLGGLINVAAQASDLSESWVKRRAGVKDSSTLLGASGGLLDVIDSLLLAAPVALLAWTWAYPAAGR